MDQEDVLTTCKDCGKAAEFMRGDNPDVVSSRTCSVFLKVLKNLPTGIAEWCEFFERRPKDATDGAQGEKT